MISKIIVSLILLLCLAEKNLSQIPKSAYVVNTLGESLTIINLENQQVTDPPLPLGLYSNQMMIRGEKGYVVISGSNEIWIFDLNSNQLIGGINLPVGSNPYALDFVSDSIAAVSLLLTNQVAFVDVISGITVQTVTVGSGPQGVKCFNRKVFVANSGFNGTGYDPGKISVIDVSNYSIETIDVGINPQSVDIDSQGNLIVACSGDYLSINARMDVVNLQTKTVIFSQPLSIPITNVAIDSDDMAYLSTYSSGVMIFNLPQRVFVRDENNPLPGGPGVAFDAQDCVYICDFAKDSIYVYNQFQQRLGAYLVGDGPLSIDIYDPNFNTLTINKRIQLADIFLYPNYPNPFNPETTILFEIRRSSPIEIEIFNILGQSVRSLINQHFSTGFYKLSWDGKDWMGVEVPAGIYICRLKYGSQFQYRKLEIIR